MTITLSQDELEKLQTMTEGEKMFFKLDQRSCSNMGKFQRQLYRPIVKKMAMDFEEADKVIELEKAAEERLTGKIPVLKKLTVAN